MLLSCAALPQAVAAQPQPAAPQGYLTADQLPDPTAYLQPPPQPGTPAFAADRAAYEASLAGRDGPAWKRAQTQLSVRSPAVQAQLMCAIGVRVDPTPASAFGRLMQRTALTLGTASEQSKAVWNRDRPYVGEGAPVACDPELDFGAHSPSYPSGHAGLGWLWGMLLAEIAPERAAAALAWGSEIGSNRIACRVHYPSDVAAGRQLGAALYARLQGDAGFRADMAAAKAEVAAARAAGATAVCPAE
jgi:acid phosphatase (class A)